MGHIIHRNNYGYWSTSCHVHSGLSRLIKPDFEIDDSLQKCHDACATIGDSQMLHFLTKSKLGLFVAGIVATKLVDSKLGNSVANKAIETIESALKSKTVKNIKTNKKKFSDE